MQPDWRLHLPRFPRKENVNEVKLCRVKRTGGSGVPWSSLVQQGAVTTNVFEKQRKRVINRT